MSGRIHVSNILKKTLEYLVLHNEMKLAHLGMLVHFGQQNGDRQSVNLPCLHLALLTYIYVNAFYNEI